MAHTDWRPFYVRLLGLILVFFCFSLTSIQASAQAGNPAYRITAGDELAVSFPRNAELDGTAIVSPDGRYNIRLLGRVPVAGLTLDEAERRISDSLESGGIAAGVETSLTVRSYGGVVFVGGEVARPGPISLTRNLRPTEAIISAGGLRNTARSRKVAVIRPSASGEAQLFKVDLREYAKTGGGSANLILAPGDIIFVPRSTIAEVGLFLDQHLNAIIPDSFNFNLNVNDSASISADNSN